MPAGIGEGRLALPALWALWRAPSSPHRAAKPAWRRCRAKFDHSLQSLPSRDTFATRRTSSSIFPASIRATIFWSASHEQNGRPNVARRLCSTENCETKLVRRGRVGLGRIRAREEGPDRTGAVVRHYCPVPQKILSTEVLQPFVGGRLVD